MTTLPGATHRPVLARLGVDVHPIDQADTLDEPERIATILQLRQVDLVRSCARSSCPARYRRRPRIHAVRFEAAGARFPTPCGVGGIMGLVVPIQKSV